MKIPVIDLLLCVDCDACIDICPIVFRRTENGPVEVTSLSDYPEQKVNEAIKRCLGRCIHWEEMEDRCES